jgi:hypothetical protein
MGLVLFFDAAAFGVVVVDDDDTKGGDGSESFAFAFFCLLIGIEA